MGLIFLGDVWPGSLPPWRQDIAMVAWAYAQPGAHDPELLRRIADHVTWEADLPRYAGRTLPTLARPPSRPSPASGDRGPGPTPTPLAGNPGD